jgi:hypothetical protein
MNRHEKVAARITHQTGTGVEWSAMNQEYLVHTGRGTEKPFPRAVDARREAIRIAADLAEDFRVRQIEDDRRASRRAGQA